ncbi:Outer membrane protein beta-barrel domain-containing protein [Chitinophaga sp. YR627]|uniref:outer membrane beta-barrel protein n=1 Tax=Chitinophaga sp. YR627 TaxID=1881041 RepID=UPI0008E0F2A4|nr:outer membrane beta-barrel protein [Chitinophaga sp. YR627]SFO59813.1 Outer membrane protein beta-barrel domain-containing protein [Chitinophaga sp. YR627]
MQLLDDDMDELFRNAASDYPLNTGGGDWEAMQNKLQQADSNQQGTATRRLKDRWWFKRGLWVLVTILFLTVAISGLFTGNRKDTGRKGITEDNTAAIKAADNKILAKNRQGIHNEKDIVTSDHTTGKNEDAGIASTDDEKYTREGTAVPDKSDSRKGSSSATADNTDKTNTPATGNTGRINEGITKPATVAAENINKGNTDKAVTALDATAGRRTGENANSTSGAGVVPGAVAGKKNAGTTNSAVTADNAAGIAGGKKNTGNTVGNVPVVKAETKGKGNNNNVLTAGSSSVVAAGKVNTDRTAIGVAKPSANNKPSTINNISIIKGGRSTIDEDDQLNTRERVASQKGRKVAANVAERDERSSAADSEQSIVNRKKGNIPVRTGETQDIPNNSSYPAARPGITAVIVSPLSIEHIDGATVKNTPPQTSLLHVDRKRNIPVVALADSSAASATKVKREPASLKKGLYYGLVFSPDLTTVKFQRTSNVGYNVGLLAGYRFGKKLAVETGVLYERKFYYSTGEYFNTKKTPWPADMDLINVDGWCNMYEIPVNVRFTFATGEKSSWYANAGMSSYIMKKQKYDYSYKYYGQYGERNWTYRKTTADWFSIIHLGVGYERPVGVLGTLRVEPYVKIPSRGIGIGDLPVTSVGMNIGLTRPLRLR